MDNNEIKKIKDEYTKAHEEELEKIFELESNYLDEEKLSPSREKVIVEDLIKLIKKRIASEID